MHGDLIELYLKSRIYQRKYPTQNETRQTCTYIFLHYLLHPNLGNRFIIIHLFIYY